MPKIALLDWYLTGSASDDTGWSDGWNPDVVRVSCIPPLNDGDVNYPFTGNIGSDHGDPVWEIFVSGSAHTGGINAVFGDGSVRGLSYDIDVYVYNSLGTGATARPTGKRQAWKGHCKAANHCGSR